MSTIEAIGVCPHCTSKSVIRFTNDGCGFEFDACPSCGYLNDGSSKSDHQPWCSILSFYNAQSMQDLERQIKNIKTHHNGRKQVFMTPPNMVNHIHSKELINKNLQGWIDSQRAEKNSDVIASAYTGSLDLILRNHAKEHGTAMIQNLFNIGCDDAAKFVDGIYGINITNSHDAGCIQLIDYEKSPF